MTEMSTPEAGSTRLRGESQQLLLDPEFAPARTFAAWADFWREVEDLAHSR